MTDEGEVLFIMENPEMLSGSNLLNLVDITFTACPFWISLIRDLNGFLKHILTHATSIFICCILITKDHFWVTISGLTTSLHLLLRFYTKKGKKESNAITITRGLNSLPLPVLG